MAETSVVMARANRGLGAHRSVASAIAFMAPCVLVLLIASTARPHDTSTSALLINLLVMFVTLGFGTIAHEAAHAAVAHFVHFTIIKVSLGCGPVVHERHIGPAHIVIQAIPITGMVYVTASSTRWLRARLAALYIAGGLANALLVAASLPLLETDDLAASLAVRPSPVLAFAVVNAMYAFFNLFPCPPLGRRAGASPGNDGWKALAAPFRSDEDMNALVIVDAAMKVARALRENRVADAMARVEEARKKYPESTLLQVTWTDVLVATQKWYAAIPLLRALLEGAELGRSFPGAVPLVANNYALCLYNSNDPERLGEANRWSIDALIGAPKNPLVQGTRGAVLLARGSLDEAEKQLTNAFAGSKPASKGRSACLLVVLHSQRGNKVEAKAWLQKARALKADPWLLARAEFSLVDAPVAPVSVSVPAVAADVEKDNDAALADIVRAQAQAIRRLTPDLPPDGESLLDGAVTPSALAAFLATHLDGHLHEKARLVAMTRVASRLRFLLGQTARQLAILEMRARVNPRVVVTFERELALLAPPRPVVGSERRAILLRHQQESIVGELVEAGYDVDRNDVRAWMQAHPPGNALAKHLFAPEADERGAAFRERLEAQLAALRNDLRTEVLLQQLAAILAERKE